MDKDIRRLINWRDIATIFGLWGLLYGVLAEFNATPFKYRIATILLPIFAVIFINQVRIWKKTEFKFILRSKNSGTAQEYLDYIPKAKNYIWVTHFRKEVPIDELIKLYDFVRNNGVKIKRVVGVKENNFDRYEHTKWIKKEISKPNTSHVFLDLENANLPFEIISIDGKLAAIALPTKAALKDGELPGILFSTNKEFINAVETMFNNYWI